jgi:hypothetical protein
MCSFTQSLDASTPGNERLEAPPNDFFLIKTLLEYDSINNLSADAAHKKL